MARAKGHRQYYGALLKNGKVQIIKRKNSRVEILAEEPYEFEKEERLLMTFRLNEELLSVRIKGQEVLQCKDDSYQRGGAGFVVNRGCILAKGFLVERAV